MKCPKCQSGNPDRMKFCGECGEKFELICSNCNFANPLQFKFCGECGHNLQKSKEPTDYTEPQSYTPKFLADKILTTRSSIEGERKLVTVFFADVANYTTLSEKLDPEEVHRIMDGCFKILMDEIHQHEGTINQFTGDGVMALFGAPLTHEDHAQRACHAALAVQDAMRSYGEKIKKDYKTNFAMRIGLNSGHVVVGSIGDNLRMDYTAVGDVTNLAARMESIATPGTVLISKNTYKMVREYFEFKTLGEIKVKGKETPQEAYELIKASKIETRLDASAAKGLTKYVGRKNSLGLLQESLEKVKSGSGQVIGIVGEAGVGKSRLLLEFQNNLPTEQYTCFEGRCLHFGGSMIYLPFLDIIKSYFEIKDSDQEFIIKKKIREKILGFDQTLTKAIPAFHDLLSLPVDDEVYSKLDPQSKRERAFEAIRDIFLFESHKSPLILIVEDLHWIDKTSEDVINYLIGWVANSQIMIILLYRPEYTHQWGSKSYYTKIGLNELGTESSSRLVEAILKADVVPELRELILNRAAGNPLFMEELTHSLLENESIKQENNKYVLSDTNDNIQVPETIQGIIASRMDRLEDNLKRTMQVASVIGRDFAFRILNTITDMREDLKSYLINLQGLEFIYEKRLFPELEYIFKHALIQEVAYNSLLQNRRKDIHENIGNAIETIYADRIEEFYEMLSYHYIKSENYEKGAEYSKLAEKKVEKSALLNESIDYAKKRIACLEKLPVTDDVKKMIIDARTGLGLYMFQLFYFVEAKKVVDPVIESAFKSGYPKRISQILSIKGAYEFFINEDFNEAIKSLQEALKIAKKVNNMPSIFFANQFLGWAYTYSCQFENALSCFKKALDINYSSNSEWGVSVSKSLLSFIVYNPQGKISIGWESSLEALKIAEKSGDVYSKATAYCAHGGSYLYKGYLVEAERYLIKAAHLGQRVSFHFLNAIAHHYLGVIYHQKRNYKKAQEHYQKTIDFLDHCKNLPSFANLNKLSIILAKKVMDKEQTGESQRLDDFVERNNLRMYDGWMNRIVGEIYYIDNRDISETESWITKAINADVQNGMQWSLGMNYFLYAKILKRHGNQNKSKSYAKKAKSVFNQCGADGWQEKVEEELSFI